MKRSKDEDKEESPVQPTTHNSSAGSNGHDAKSPVATTAPAATLSAAVSDTSGAGAGASVRTTGRVKKPKQVYDPSDNYVSRASSNRNSLGGTVVSAAPATSNIQSPPAKEASDSQDSTPSPVVSEQQQQQQQAAQHRNFDTCQNCSKSEPKRGSGHKSNFLTCKGCMQKWHFPCLPVTFQNQSTARKKYKCDKCRYCQVCNVRGRDLSICSSCVEAFHPDCNDPTLKQSKSVDNNPKWRCFRCEASNSGNNTSPSSEEQTAGRKSTTGREDQPVVPRKSNAGRKKRVQSEPTGQEKPAKIEKIAKRSPPLKTDEKSEKKEEKREYKKEEETEEIQVKVEKVEPVEMESVQIENQPENQIEPKQEAPPSRLTPIAAVDSPVEMKGQPVSSWSVEQVVHFVAKHYPKEANVFRYQDIDGASLLLLTRQDVMNGFGLKLGPALRVFELVMSLQSRSDDVRLAWLE
ncbi:histone-lysine N-methyltransferase 2D [Drosophila santomea]|uniref:histone-lysine N-methyltransferase 2D n=1 Tax=Drosophila santomea TaxID=129105 RepID=UPI001954428E|nr:histone-lysine N-methyltransferase 2D [Drosophila santomea]